MSLFDVVGELGLAIFGNLLPAPSTLAGQALMAFIVGLGSATTALVGVLSLDPSYAGPEWAFGLVVSSCVGGIFAFVLGLACFSKAVAARSVPALATSLGLIAMLAFPSRLLLAG